MTNNPQMTQMDADKKDIQTYEIIGAAMRVHGELGSGFLEAVYQEALEKEFFDSGIHCQREVGIPITYKGLRLKTQYKADFVCYRAVIVELKAISKLSGTEESQLIHYLKATGYTKGLLLNFGSSKLEIKRIVFNLRESAKSADD